MQNTAHQPPVCPMMPAKQHSINSNHVTLMHNLPHLVVTLIGIILETYVFSVYNWIHL